MSSELPTRDGQYSDTEHLQFHQGRALRIARGVLGALTWPVVLPLALVSRSSDMVFRTVSEFLSLVPYVLGIIVRGEFYRFALRRCGRNVVVEFGAIFIYRDVAIGDNVIIGRYNIVHHCDFGSYALTGERCTFLSGSQQHRYGRTDIPMALQGGRIKRISVGDDCWIGAHAVVMDDVGKGSIVGAGSVVVQPIPAFTVALGAPARPVQERA